MSWFDITPDWAPTREPLAWMRRAACAGQSDYIFYTPRLYSEAKKLCAQCPVIRECLALADRAESTQKDVYGVFGGETPCSPRRRG